MTRSVEDDILDKYAERLQEIYEKKTAGDYTFLGVLATFLMEIDRERGKKKVVRGNDDPRGNHLDEMYEKTLQTLKRHSGQAIQNAIGEEVEGSVSDRYFRGLIEQGIPVKMMTPSGSYEVCLTNHRMVNRWNDNTKKIEGVAMQEEYLPKDLVQDSPEHIYYFVNLD